MAKLTTPESVEHYIGEVLVKVTPAPGYKVASAMKLLEGIKSDMLRVERTIDIYLGLIVEYTDLENTKEELKEIMTFDDIMAIGDIITGTSKIKEKANLEK